jgi:hypothetical protein
MAADRSWERHLYHTEPARPAANTVCTPLPAYVTIDLKQAAITTINLTKLKFSRGYAAFHPNSGLRSSQLSS